MNEYPDLYVQFLYYFNTERDYYECHEVLEELWLDEGRPALYQGLLQAAVALYHFGNNNVSGAIKLFEAGIAKMENHHSGHSLGIDLDPFITDCKAYLRRLEQIDTKPFDFYTLDILITDPALAAEVELLGNNNG